MSSSKGNVFLLEDAIDEFGADTVRMFLTGSAEPWQDFDWRNELVLSVKKQIERFWAAIQENAAAKGAAGGALDTWLESRLQGRIARTTRALDSSRPARHSRSASMGWKRTCGGTAGEWGRRPNQARP